MRRKVKLILKVSTLVAGHANRAMMLPIVGFGGVRVWTGEGSECLVQIVGEKNNYKTSTSKTKKEMEGNR
jgi:hypothetical protein